MHESEESTRADSRAAVRPPALSDDETKLLAKLSPKQREVLRLTLLGKSSKQIAIEVGITPRGVDQRLDSARRTLGASERHEAARRFYELHRASEGLTSDPFLVGDAVPYGGSGERDPSPYLLGDVLTFTAPAAWDKSIETRPQAWRGIAPGLPSATSGPQQRITWIVIGAIAILTLVILGLGAVEGLMRLDARV